MCTQSQPSWAPAIRRYPIAGGRVEGDRLLFDVVRERNGRKMVSSFSALVRGDQMTAKVVSKWGEGERSYDLVVERQPE